jgi:hypothetical protein
MQRTLPRNEPRYAIRTAIFTRVHCSLLTGGRACTRWPIRKQHALPSNRLSRPSLQQPACRKVGVEGGPSMGRDMSQEGHGNLQHSGGTVAVFSTDARHRNLQYFLTLSRVDVLQRSDSGQRLVVRLGRMRSKMAKRAWQIGWPIAGKRRQWIVSTSQRSRTSHKPMLVRQKEKEKDAEKRVASASQAPRASRRDVNLRGMA